MLLVPHRVGNKGAGLVPPPGSGRRKALKSRRGLYFFADASGAEKRSAAARPNGANRGKMTPNAPSLPSQWKPTWSFQP